MRLWIVLLICAVRTQHRMFGTSQHPMLGNEGNVPKIEILSPVVRERKGEYSTLLGEMWKRGFSEAYVDGKKIDLTEKAKQGLILARYKKHSIDVKIDRSGNQ